MNESYDAALRTHLAGMNEMYQDGAETSFKAGWQACAAGNSKHTLAAFSEAVLYGAGVMRGGQHVPHDAIFDQHVRPHVTVQYDLSPAETESQLRAKLIEMGWTPPSQNKQAEPVLQGVMRRLADLLDEDQFAEIEGMVVRAGIAPPSNPTPAVADLVKAASEALKEIQNAMHEAYNNATPVCCGRSGSECCGCPEPQWSEQDQKTISRFEAHEKELRAALAKHGASK